VSFAQLGIQIATHLYRLLLYLYPAAFRREFGREMVMIFHDMSWAAMERGGSPALIGLWISYAGDLISTALVERLREIFNMSTSRFSRFASATGILFGLFLTLTVVYILSQVLSRPAFSPPIQWHYMMLLGAAWMIVVTIVLYIQGDFGGVGKRALGLTTVGLALVTASGIFVVVDFDPGNGAPFVSVLALGLLIQGLGIAAFGRSLRVQSELRAWSKPLLVAGLSQGLLLPVSLFVILYFVHGGFGYNPDMGKGVSSFVYGGVQIAQGIGWMLLGGLSFLRSSQPLGAPFQLAG
jgi:hypothetical protein